MSIFGEIFKVTLVPFFIPNFISLSCELDNFVCTRLFWVILHWYYVKAKWKCSTLTVPHEKFIMVSFAFSIMKKVVLFTSLSKTYSSGNKTTPQIHTENDTKKKEPKSIKG